MFRFFRNKLRSNQPINPVESQNQILQQLQKVNQKNANIVNRTPDMQAKSLEMLQRQEQMLRNSRFGK